MVTLTGLYRSRIVLLKVDNGLFHGRTRTAYL